MELRHYVWRARRSQAKGGASELVAGGGGLVTRDLRRALVSAACAVVGGLATAAIAGDPSATTAPVTTPQYTLRQPLSASDQSSLSQALEAARLGDAPRIRVLMNSIYDPLARKIALWALVETGPQG